MKIGTCCAKEAQAPFLRRPIASQRPTTLATSIGYGNAESWRYVTGMLKGVSARTAPRVSPVRAATRRSKAPSSWEQRAMVPMVAPEPGAKAPLRWERRRIQLTPPCRPTSWPRGTGNSRASKKG